MHSLKPRILVVNCGSSSLKFALIEGEAILAEGLFERLGLPDARGRWKIVGESSSAGYAGITHEGALAEAVALMEAKLGKPLSLDAVGHRVVHGGEFFSAATLVDDGVVEKIERCRELAPLHNPAHAVGIRVARKLFPDIPHVTVFDTAFHQTMPERAWMYALPPEMHSRYAVRRYGAHGTSHAYVAAKAAEAIGRPLAELQLITAHLGNGCSACAVRGGKSVDTTMGLTPLEGLMMGTRSGDVDPNIVSYLNRVSDMSAQQVIEMLNHRSGLLGVSGLSNDLRTVVGAAAEGSQQAGLAIDLFCYRLAKGILSMAAGLDRIDALVFTGGIGENSDLVRARTMDSLRILRPEIDAGLNSSHGRDSGGRITLPSSGLLCLVIPTSEERAIAAQTAAFISPP